MKQVYVYSLALALALAMLATPSKANGIASTNVFTVSMQDFPDVVSRGDEIGGTVTITMNAEGDGRSARRYVNYALYVSTPLGDAPVESGSFSMRVDTPRTIKISQPLDEKASQGLYKIKLVVTIGDSSTSVDHDLDVR